MGPLPNLDAAGIPEPRRVVEEAQVTGQPVVVRLGSDEVAMIMPIASSPAKRAGRPTQEQIDVLMSAAGSWEGLVDVEELKTMWRQAHGSRRPPIAL